MSQHTKKSIKLSTRINKLKNSKNRNDSSLLNFTACSASAGKQSEKTDGSLFSVDTLAEHTPLQATEVDVFTFPNKEDNILFRNKTTTITRVTDNDESKIHESESIFDQDTIVNPPKIVFKKTKSNFEDESNTSLDEKPEIKEELNDSSLIFTNYHKSISKSKDTVCNQTSINSKNISISDESKVRESKSIFDQDTIVNPPTILFEERKSNFNNESNAFLGKKTEIKEEFNDSSSMFTNYYKHMYKSKDIVSNPTSLNSKHVLKTISIPDDDIFSIPDSKVIVTPTEKVDTDNLLEPLNCTNDESINQCPICFKTVSKYINHMKSCAAKNNITTQQLLSALKLHKKQIAERKELGLGLPVQSFRAKASPKRSRTNDKKGPVDSNLQLALALSASLRSAEETELIQEAEVLQQAGLTDEAEHKLSTLEKFGFASAITARPQAGSSKSRFIPPSLLLKRSKEDRERIITEKVAIVLINEDEYDSLPTFINKEQRIKSKLLNKMWNKDILLWKKAQCPIEEERNTFYLNTLSNFVSPIKSEINQGLRRRSLLPECITTLEEEEFGDHPTTPVTPADFSEEEEKFGDHPTTPVTPADFSESVNIFEVPTPPPTSSLQKPTSLKNNNLKKQITNLANDWRRLVSSSKFSDVDIKCKDGSLSGHKLVFYARCPHILQMIVEKENDKDMIIIENISKNTGTAFLEFVYSGDVHKINYLDNEEFQCLLKLAIDLGCLELEEILKDYHRSINRTTDEDIFLHEGSTIFGMSSKSNKPLNDEAQSGKISGNSWSSGRTSPDMFGGSGFLENKSKSSQGSRDDLDMLASLMNKSPSDYLNESKTANNTQVEEKESTNTSGILLINNSLLNKRKARDSSFSDDENISLPKKVCSNLSNSVGLENADQDDVFDLTQSSTSSSKGPSPFQSPVKENDKVILNNSTDKLDDDSLQDLTQQNPHSPSISEKYPADTNTSVTRQTFNDNLHEDYIDPVWDGFPDDYYFDHGANSPLNTTNKFNTEKSSEKECLYDELQLQDHTGSNPLSKCNYSSNSKSPRTPVKSSQNSAVINCVSSDSKSNPSPKELTQIILNQSPNSLGISPSTNYISSESKSPRMISQHTTSTNYSPKSNKSCIDNFNDSDIEIVENVNSPKHVSGNNFTRKNLSSQFDSSLSTTTYPGRLNNTSTESPKHEAKESSFQELSQKYTHKSNSRCGRTDSLVAMQRLLDDSLDVSDSVFSNADAMSSTSNRLNVNEEIVESRNCFSNNSCQTTKYQKNNTVLNTPSPEIIVSDNVTPLADYSAMKTPVFKRELTKFGLKPSLGRRKGKLLLRHIYEQTHPLVPTKEQRTQSPVKSPQKKIPKVNLDDNSESDESTSSSLHSSTCLSKDDLLEFEDVLTQELPTNGDTRSSIRNLILTTPELHQKILMYDPIPLEEFMAMLKANGIRTKINQVVEFLDEQCITFRTENWKQRNKKKKKITIQGGELHLRLEDPATPEKITSHTQLHPQPIKKKRGRPRKEKFVTTD